MLESERIEKVGHNLKFDLSVLKWQGLTVHGKLFDTMVAHSLIEPGDAARHGLPVGGLSRLHADPDQQAYRRRQGGPGEHGGMCRWTRRAEYAAEDADVTWQLRAAA